MKEPFMQKLYSQKQKPTVEKLVAPQILKYWNKQNAQPLMSNQLFFDPQVQNQSQFNISQIKRARDFHTQNIKTFQIQNIPQESSKIQKNIKQKIPSIRCKSVQGKTRSFENFYKVLKSFNKIQSQQKRKIKSYKHDVAKQQLLTRQIYTNNSQLRNYSSNKLLNKVQKSKSVNKINLDFQNNTIKQNVFYGNIPNNLYKSNNFIDYGGKFYIKSQFEPPVQKPTYKPVPKIRIINNQKYYSSIPQNIQELLNKSGNSLYQQLRNQINHQSNLIDSANKKQAG